MQQIKRNEAVKQLINEIDEGTFQPVRINKKVRVVSGELVEQTPKGFCVVCNVALFRHQVKLCAGHWDYLIVPQVVVTDPQAFREYLEINLSDTSVLIMKAFWLGVIKGHYFCEICDVTTANIEFLSASGKRIKDHSVCEEHQSFRSE